MIRAFRGVLPRLASSAYIDPSAQVIGDVTLGEAASIWCNATVRGDVSPITIGHESNIQDNSVLHADEGFPLKIGNRVTIGHSVVLHGCTIGNGTLIGIGAIVLNGAKIGSDCVIAAGALVPEGMEIPDGSLAMGVPAKVRREVTADEKERFRVNADHYVELAHLYLKEYLIDPRN